MSNWWLLMIDEEYRHNRWLDEAARERLATAADGQDRRTYERWLVVLWTGIAVTLVAQMVRGG